MEEESVISQGSKRTFPAEEPTVAATPPVPPLGDAFDDPARFENYAILALPASSYGSVLGDDDEDGEAYNNMRRRATASSDSDSEFEDHDNRVRFWDGDAFGSETDLVAGLLTFLGRQTRFASFQGAAGFMRLSAAQASPGGEEDSEGGAIVVHYRITRFSRTPRGVHGVEVRDFGTALHHVRYFVPFPVAATDAASSLRLVGAALAADVYPYRYYVQLQALWSSLVAAIPVRVPARATRLVVTVDVGVLRSEDRTPERMELMRVALAALARENDDALPMACGLEQHLPAPVCCDGGSAGGDDRPAKRMKRFAVAGEVCAICHETLEHGLAAWPRCSHVFHGKCLEQLLVTVQHRCPMCRSMLSIKGSMLD
ncbi:unnamed protein product [Miscanthus lutarioriparius]|uniref:RING-type domain-containing protein n=1 Tax=Miscanthus lutarioriparius TaxID=422564 RepID=A0A811QCM1_9POAL|nr:unnamed protein product [Miscanthus lutarioriparius]